MGRPAGWMKALTGRSPMKSPGAPALRREVEREFWREIARGVTAEEAAIAIGVSPAAGSRWFRQGGGMPSVDLAPLSGRYLSFREREEIALLRAHSLASGRSPGASAVIPRRFRGSYAATQPPVVELDYRPSVAQWKADLVARRPKTAKLVADERLREYVQERLSGQVHRPDGTPVPGPVTTRGRAGTSRTAKIVGGSWGGVRSRSLTGSRSSSRMISPCASA